MSIKYEELPIDEQIKINPEEAIKKIESIAQQIVQKEQSLFEMKVEAVLIKYGLIQKGEVSNEPK
jgi:hypothetical protein